VKAPPTKKQALRALQTGEGRGRRECVEPSAITMEKELEKGTKKGNGKKKKAKKAPFLHRSVKHDETNPKLIVTPQVKEKKKWDDVRQEGKNRPKKKKTIQPVTGNKREAERKKSGEAAMRDNCRDCGAKKVMRKRTGRCVGVRRRKICKNGQASGRAKNSKDT